MDYVLFKRNSFIGPFLRSMMDQAHPIALQRIRILLQQAAENIRDHPERSHRYALLASKIATRTRLRLPSSLKRKICRHCHRYLHSGITCRIRTRDQKLIQYCFHCKHYRRMSIRPTKSAV